MKNPSLAEGQFFQMEKFQAQLDEITDTSESQAFFEKHQDTLSIWIDTPSSVKETKTFFQNICTVQGSQSSA